MEHKFSTEGIGAQYVTLNTLATQEDAGKLCELTGENTVTVCAEGGKFCGVLHSVKDGVACVQTDGFCQVKYSGTMPTLGYILLAGGTNGKVAVNNEGRELLVVDVDTTAKTVTFKL